MTSDRADWAKEIAAEIERGARELLEFARAQDEAFWEEPSALEGWSRRDVLAHLAGDTRKVSERAMRAAIEGTPFEDAPDFKDGGDADNARDVEERRGHTVARLLAEIECDRKEWLTLLGRLSEDDEHRRWPRFPMTLGEYLRHCATHDRDHLAQIRPT
jgi:uncharacterized protein (TIGR03083 family)